MAWYLNEVLTDLSVLPGALPVLSRQRAGAPEPNDVAEYLRGSGMNLDLLDETIGPEEHGGDVYRWLAADLQVLCRKLSLIEPQGPAEPPVRLTELGSALVGRTVTLESALVGGLFHWRFGDSESTAPMLPILEVLRQMSDKTPYPGLLLPEFILTMKKLEGGGKEGTVDACVQAILGRRKGVAGNAGESAIERLCELYLSQEDALSERDVTRGRTTQVNILSSGLARYGGLLDEAHFMEIGRGLMKEEEVRRLADGTPREIARFLDNPAGSLGD